MSTARAARRLPALPSHHALAAAALVLLSGGAAAQASGGQLQTITVTAERRLENIRDVPSSVSALQGEMLEVLNSGGQDIRLLAGRAPSLNIESSFGRAFPRFYIRGIGNTDFDLNASQPVSLVYDDVVQENPILKGFPIFDMERIEVLNGPQGTLFGRNSPAGVVKFESVKPGKKFEGYALASLGRFSALNLEGAVNVPLSPTVSLRVAAQSQNRDDWVKNGYPAGPTRELEGYNDNAARVQLLWSPSKEFSALANLHTRDLKGSARVFRANIIQPGTNNLVAGFDKAKVYQDGINSQDVSNTGGSLRLRWDLGNGMALNSITGYETVDSLSRGDIDGGYGNAGAPAPIGKPFGPGFIPFDAESADGMPKHKQFTQEFRLESTGSGALQWLAGVYYFDEQLKIDSFNYSSLGGNTLNGLAKQDQQNKAWAVFGSVNLEVSPQLKLRGGLRYTQDDKDFFADRLIAPPFSPTFIGRRTAATSASNVSGDFSASYALDKTTNVYGRVATGFRAPAIQGRLLFGDTLSVARSEKVTSYEAGVKADLMNGRARVSAAVFSYIIKDQQLTAVGGAANFNQLVNADKTAGQGFEFNTQWLVTERLLLTLGGSYNSTKIKDPGLRVDACGSGCTVKDPITAPINPAIGKFAPTVSIDGNPLPQAPKQTLNFTARYSMPIQGGDLVLLTDVVYRSKINFFLYESTEFTGKSLTEVGVRAGYNFGNGKYEAAAFVRNLTDTTRVVGGIDFNNLTGFINEPRTYGVSFKANF
ncbi:MAG: TonB-dependent receptor [Leptothrix sp. (in: Bacteria)]|nr:TonB-dependent receptor [Leptothrix sp. (in: b-proteobacteria)]